MGRLACEGVTGAAMTDDFCCGGCTVHALQPNQSFAETHRHVNILSSWFD